MKELLALIKAVEERKISSDEVPREFLRPVKDYFRWKLLCENLRHVLFPRFSFSPRFAKLVELKILAEITGNQSLKNSLPRLPESLRPLENRVKLKRILKARKKLPENVLFSMPEFLYERWKSNYSEEFAEMLSALKKVDFPPGEISESSKLVCEHLSPEEGDRVLEVGVGKGLKTSFVLKRLRNRGVRPSIYMAIDVDEKRLEEAKKLLSPTPEYLRLTKCDVLLLRSSEKFDWILLDAPCTGSGVIARKPEIRYRISQKSLEKLSNLQKEMLKASLKLLKPGGTLVYSVCSVEPEEGPEVAKAFRETIPLRDFLLLPAQENSDGFYFAVLKKVKRT